jgi:hypothetical protein
MSESIEAFEVWRKQQIASLVRTGHLDAARAFEQLGSIQGSVWDSAWQASRETPVIKRPEKCEFAEPDGSYHKGYRQGMRSMVDAIEAAGLKVSQ